jgi:hypothetical protein
MPRFPEFSGIAISMAPGKTRTCPHCKATILESATVCPGCQHHLRFDPAALRMLPAATPLKVEGMIRHPSGSETCEYTIVLAVRNERGEELTRQVVGVGVLAPNDVRSFSVAVELFAPHVAVREVRAEPRAAQAAAASAAAARPAQPAAGNSPFRDPRDPRTRPPTPVSAAPPAAGRSGAPPLPRDPRPPATQTQVRTLPAGAQPAKDRPKG